ncbi:hypothetical protein DYB25_010222 [Aphanomyces astaci]|uniref:Uncharacterized protein n=1 Tax=Aphanomyces astaci TaxID=112090 RepID=A0A397EUR4_APHAT|nr:hypothetical protein DYB25_010222 [Aphanomyces astaci]RHY42655.1 hypothetical protein DYB38_010615 [Aphanomyces astaci]RHY68568.1 hypothetical protein DYB30_009252 [Aphanomyces astaci]RHZ05761.1 hypothetical protein DYB31_008827 [Aphanomyces astaci]RHZ32394.1 hypothetical protein DYB26_006947 [Aphanomyces astaci]
MQGVKVAADASHSTKPLSYPMACLLNYWSIVVPTKSANELEAERWLVVVPVSTSDYARMHWVLFSRWQLFAVCFGTQVCCGSLYAFVFISDALDVYFYGQVTKQSYSIVLKMYIFMGVTAALLGPMLERKGPRVGMAMATVLITLGFVTIYDPTIQIDGVTNLFWSTGMTLVNYSAVHHELEGTDGHYFQQVRAMTLLQCILSTDFIFLYIAFAANVIPLLVFVPQIVTLAAGMWHLPPSEVNKLSQAMLLLVLCGLLAMLFVRTNSTDRFYRGYQYSACGKVLLQVAFRRPISETCVEDDSVVILDEPTPPSMPRTFTLWNEDLDGAKYNI